MNEEQKKLRDDLKGAFAAYKSWVKRKAHGALRYDYLVPAGYYEEQWDWDGFFIGVALSSELSSEAIYLRNWALNYLNAADSEGYTPGCVTPKGAEKGHRLFLMKPFLAQGVYLASRFLHDFSWVKPYWKVLKNVVLYRRKHRWSEHYGLVVLENAMETGADDNVAAFGFPDNTVIAADMNTYTLREYKAMSLIAKEISEDKDKNVFRDYADMMKTNMLQHLWHAEDKIFYNRSTKTGEYIKRVSISDFVPLWEGIAPVKDGRESLRRYVREPKHLWSVHGIRTLSKNDPDYNNVNRIKPYSNWQGPIWPLANYLYTHALHRYGFKKESYILAMKVIHLLLEDIKKNGGMHENYDAETGQPLAAPNFVSWNLLIGNLLDELESRTNPFELH